MPRRVISYSLVVQCIKDLNRLSVSVDTVSVRVVSNCHFVHCTRILYLSLVPRAGKTRHDVTSRFYIAAYVVPLHNNLLLSAVSRSVDYRHSIDRRRQPSPLRSPRDRSSGRILWSRRHSSLLSCVRASFPYAMSGDATQILIEGNIHLCSIYRIKILSEF